jgi:hypothetical protein
MQHTKRGTDQKLLMPMAIRPGVRLGSEPNNTPFITIDDCLTRARELATLLTKLAAQKYPLDVRRGISLKPRRKGVSAMVNAETSKVVKAGGNTYFFDIKKTKDGRPYLVITESRFQGEGKARVRTSLTLFPEHARDFLEAVKVMVDQL